MELVSTIPVRISELVDVDERLRAHGIFTPYRIINTLDHVIGEAAYPLVSRILYRGERMAGALILISAPAPVNGQRVV